MFSDKLREVYLDWINNYISVPVFAEHNGLTYDQACKVIELGHDCHESYVAMMKEIRHEFAQ